jgi:hypothetical protein
MSECYYVPNKEINQVTWKGNSLEYDTELYNLGKGHDNFIIVNPLFKFLKFNLEIPSITSNACVVFKYQDMWVAKHYTKDWIKEKQYHEINLDTDIKFSHPDIFFISYNEPNAEINWLRVLEKAPKAKRIDGIKGIVNAHKYAADLSTTDMFYVVDGDAYIVDDFNFDFQPNIFNRKCVHVWTSKNPVNDLTYGYGGVKLLPKELTLEVNEFSIDMTTSISRNFKIFDQVSNITCFNNNEFNTFRSAFRECVKLSSGIFSQESNLKTNQRLDAWCTQGEGRPYGEWAIKGALAGKQYGKDNAGDIDAINLINDLEFIQLKFKELT